MSKNKFKRTKIKSTSERPRVVVYKSNSNIFVQIIDDEGSKTLTDASSLKLPKMKKTEAAREVGKQLAIKAKEKNITTVVFDRNRHVYKGRVKALAESARENGLVF